MQRVYILSENERWNVVGIYTNIRQVKKCIASRDSAKFILYEMRMNEIPTGKYSRDVTWMIAEKTED